jgi:cytochrome c2
MSQDQDDDDRELSATGSLADAVAKFHRSARAHVSLLAYVRLSALIVILLAMLGYHYSWHGFQDRYPEVQWYVPAADSQRGQRMLHQYGCGGCHVVPGVPGARGQVGPPLDRLTDHMYIAGVLPHSPQNLVLWIQDPRGVSPRTAMPNLGVAEQDARDMAAYLYGLHERPGGIASKWLGLGPPSRR